MTKHFIPLTTLWPLNFVSVFTSCQRVLNSDVATAGGTMGNISPRKPRVSAPTSPYPCHSVEMFLLLGYVDEPQRGETLLCFPERFMTP